MRLDMLFLLATASSQAQAIQRNKFHKWLPYYEGVWKRQSQMCQAQLTMYYTNNRTDSNGHETAPCAAVVDCLLSNVSESIKSNIASADIVLGITPQILSFVGPSSGELAILSTDSPVLTSLLSFGFPSRSIAGLFVSIDVADILRAPVAKTARAYHSWLAQQSSHVRLVLLTLVYAAAAAAVVNNIYTSIYLDLRTVSGWRCGADYMPLSWSIAGFPIALIETLAIRTRSIPGALRRGWLSRFHRRDKSQPLPCILPEAQDGLLTEILFVVVNFFSIVQSVIGTVILSALLFISFLDALPILARYGTSALICSLLLRLELAGLKCKVEAAQEARGNKKTEIEKEKEKQMENDICSDV